MTIESEDQLDKLRAVGRLVARTLAATGKALDTAPASRAVHGAVRAHARRH